ncbi:LPS translocon maturation chaperone LptM [Roseibium aestuarii]|uniref:Lipoprotein n=1 Tax=Roseibium aestuarii TaxID=2600299 RepID=A0ABW4K195_9HYPH|nr:lipoprotein [Roseibium aestuarii]
MAQGTDIPATPDRKGRMIRSAVLVLAGVVAVSLGGCGRKGSLETPGLVDVPAAAPQVSTATGSQVVTPPAEQPVDQRRFFLDFLI